MRPIDADALKEEISSLRMVITGLRCGKGVLSEYAREHLKSILRIIDESPTIDTEPVRHGRWEWYEEPYDSRNPDGDYGWRCSECKQDLAAELTLGIPGMHYACAIIDDPDAQPTLKRCVFCGAKMDAKED